ncbi:hypothetical protein BKA70DRAFT_1237724 [Coprinopsis sp. MPI-PUGE-AT-0042]|nr:hypothetical protein BKA70DRAFT_1237724 [Coprinopsis sp. MPI-PUGE-AT-0042]
MTSPVVLGPWWLLEEGMPNTPPETTQKGQKVNCTVVQRDIEITGIIQQDTERGTRCWEHKIKASSGFICNSESIHPDSGASRGSRVNGVNKSPHEVRYLRVSMVVLLHRVVNHGRQCNTVVGNVEARDQASQFFDDSVYLAKYPFPTTCGRSKFESGHFVVLCVGAVDWDDVVASTGVMRDLRWDGVSSTTSKRNSRQGKTSAWEGGPVEHVLGYGFPEGQQTTVFEAFEAADPAVMSLLARALGDDVGKHNNERWTVLLDSDVWERNERAQRTRHDTMPPRLQNLMDD